MNGIASWNRSGDVGLGRGGEPTSQPIIENPHRPAGAPEARDPANPTSPSVEVTVGPID